MPSIRDISLVVPAPRTGTAQSPHVGVGNIVNLDLYTVPGIVQLNNIMAQVSGTTVTAQPTWAVRHPITTTEIYVLDSSGNIYKSTNSGATWTTLTGETSGGHGNGLWIWKNYLFVARDAFLDVCGDGTPTGISAGNWTNSWEAIDSDSLWHPMLTSRNDNKLYGGAGRFVFSLDENTGQTFAPGNAATFTWDQEALDLPPAYRIKCIEELGNNLMLGTWQGTNLYDIRIANIFPWDRSSPSFGQVVVIADYGVHAMLNVGNTLIILAGINGTIFKCDGANAYIIGQLPMDLSGGKYLEFYPGALMSYKNKVFFGVGQGGSTAISPMGVYSIWQTGKGNIVTLEHLVSTQSDGSTAPLKPSILLPISRDTMLLGWNDNSVYGLDLTTDTSYNYPTAFSGYFESPLYVIGDLDFLSIKLKIQFRFAKPLQAGEGIRIKFRNNLSDSWTTQGTYKFTATAAGDVQLGGVLSHQVDPGIPQCEMLQFRVELLGNTTTPQFKSLRLEDYFLRGSQAINQQY